MHRCLRSAIVVAVTVVGAGCAPTATPDPGDPSSALTVTALGDSVPSAYGCDCDGYVQTFADLLATRTSRPVTVHNDAVAGATSADVLAAVRGAAARDVARSDVVIVQVGANDVDVDLLEDPRCERSAVEVCWGSDLRGLRANLDRIATSTATGPGRPLVLLVDYWNVSVDGAVARARGPASRPPVLSSRLR